MSNPSPADLPPHEVSLSEIPSHQIPKGWIATGCSAGIKPSGKSDLSLFLSERPATWAGMFTTNRCAAACVERGRTLLEASGSARGVIVNSGNANAATGKLGAENDAALAAKATDACTAAGIEGVAPEQLLTASTGVIGVQLPMEKVVAAIPTLSGGLSGCLEDASKRAKGFTAARAAIMTTDTRPKSSVKIFKTESGEGRLVGVAKGAGMIHPNMATMLAFLFTDVSINQALMRDVWRPIVEETFNAITIDGDTSTNDMALLFANGASEAEVSSQDDIDSFSRALREAATELSEAIVLDQEGGVRVLCRIAVTGAAKKSGARAAAETLATSLLFKTALHGADPNWGRIVAALGRSGARFETDKVRIQLGEHLLFEAGQPLAFDKKKASEYLRTAGTVHLNIDLGMGDEQAHYLTANLSEEYVTFNSAYTT